MKRRIRIAWIALACTAACGDADVAGNYTVATVDRSDTCSIGSWNTGMQRNATFTVDQSGSDITLRITGGTLDQFISVLLGTNTFTGGVDGDDVSASITGTMPQTSGACTFTLNARIIASQDGDALNGRVEYRIAPVGEADCSSREDCVAKQDFNATRLQ